MSILLNIFHSFSLINILSLIEYFTLYFIFQLVFYSILCHSMISLLNPLSFNEYFTQSLSTNVYFTQSVSSNFILLNLCQPMCILLATKYFDAFNISIFRSKT